jgi:hypothetical protein
LYPAKTFGTRRNTWRQEEMQRNMKGLLASVAACLSFFGSASAVAMSYLFEYSGRVAYATGTVTDGTLLDFKAGDAVAGAFVFVPGALDHPPGAMGVQYANTIPLFEFGSAAAPSGYSSLLMDAARGVVIAYKQNNVAGSLYDTYEFVLEGDRSGRSRFDSFDDLTSLRLANYGDGYFILTRVDISSSPLRFTEVKVAATNLVVTRIMDVSDMFADLLAKTAGVGPGNSMASKVREAEYYYGAGNSAQACSALSALANQVNAQSGKHLTKTQAASLLGRITELSDALHCAG